MMWKLLEYETELAKSVGRIPFTFVDLTAKEFLPVWMPQSTVSAKGKELEAEGTLETQTLGKLGEALRKATTTSRAFRSVTQWTLAFQRYAVVAVGTGQLTQVTVYWHMAIILKLVEEEATNKGDSMVAILYHEMLRNYRESLFAVIINTKTFQIITYL